MTKTPTMRMRKSFMTNHETFHLRYSWINKGLASIKNQSPNFDHPEAHHELGIGINMLKSLGYWMQATKLAQFTHTPKGIDNPFELTDIGKIVENNDIYLEQIGTIWLLQYEVATNRSLSPLWYWIFNISRAREFTDETLMEGLTLYLQDESRPKLAKESIKRDIRCLKRSYIPSLGLESKGYGEDLLDCPLSELNLIKKSSARGVFTLNTGGHSTLPLDIFKYACWKYKESQDVEKNSISLDELRWNPGSPGRVFCLDSSETLSRLEELHNNTEKSIRLTRSEGISRVIFEQETTSSRILEKYYKALS